MSQALNLFRLQRTDSQLDQITDQITKLENLLSTDAELQAVIKKANETESILKRAELNFQKTDDDVKAQQLKIEQTESSLYSGIIKNPKELQDLQLDLGSLKRHLSTLEDRLLDAMEALESAEKSRRECEGDLIVEKQRTSNNNLNISIELSGAKKQKEKLESERSAIAYSLNEEFVRLYETLRKQKRGVAVSTIIDNTCSICGATLTPSKSQSVHSSTELIHCPTCGRILYGN